MNSVLKARETMKQIFDALVTITVCSAAFEIALAIVGAIFKIPALRRWEKKTLSRFKHEEDW